MTVNSYLRGHPIIWIENKNNIVRKKGEAPEPSDVGQWLYKDTMEPIPTEGGEIRPCIKCGKLFEGSYEGMPDPCLGRLPGVNNACCGHGIKEESYIRFTNGTIIKGFEIEIQTK